MMRLWHELTRVERCIAVAFIGGGALLFVVSLVW